MVKRGEERQEKRIDYYIIIIHSQFHTTVEESSVFDIIIIPKFMFTLFQPSSTS